MDPSANLSTVVEQMQFLENSVPRTVKLRRSRAPFRANRMNKLSCSWYTPQRLLSLDTSCIAGVLPSAVNRTAKPRTLVTLSVHLVASITPIPSSIVGRA